ncbi:hypothetical protein F5878DRAFT_547765 [Lentinula raphanica]|uniref:Uncharacterized protein n=1 Tax=Lentinula raphanica TaxID=153919 RepID=A0AA38NY63_9AGAR|nr:hypothetical protein F5878DRAFT_547765 [Lentinula raphanica]
MLPTGRLKGLHLYWEGKVNIPSIELDASKKSTPKDAEPLSIDGTSKSSSTLAQATSTPINDPSPTVLEYELRESVAYLTLWNNIKNPDGLGIPHGMSPDKLWEYLETEFQKVTTIARQRKEDNLRACRYVKGTKITGDGGYAEKMRLLLKEANDCGSNISLSQFNTIFLNSFPRTTEWLVMTGNLMGEPSFTVIVSRLEEFFLHSRGGSNGPGVSVSSGDRVSALQTEVDSLKALLTQNRPKGPVNPDLVCSNPNCKGRGHVIENCWKMGGGKQGQYPKWWKGRRDAPVTGNPTVNHVTTSTTVENSITNGQIYALSATILKTIAEPCINPKGRARTFADSGATAHFFHDQNVFRNYVKKK